MRAFSIRTPDGHRIRFGEPTKAASQHQNGADAPHGLCYRVAVARGSLARSADTKLAWTGKLFGARGLQPYEEGS